MAVVDARDGRIYFPPFETVEGSDYGLPFVDKGNNPAWKLNSRLFAFGGIRDGKGESGLYLYRFDRNRFRFVRFVREEDLSRMLHPSMTSKPAKLPQKR